jgi:hypothetical protein
MDTVDGIEVRDESEGKEKVLQLYINGLRRGCITRRPNGEVKLHWQVYGPITFQEAKVQVEGLLRLMVLGNQL